MREQKKTIIRNIVCSSIRDFLVLYIVPSIFKMQPLHWRFAFLLLAICIVSQIFIHNNEDYDGFCESFEVVICAYMMVAVSIVLLIGIMLMINKAVTII